MFRKHFYNSRVRKSVAIFGSLFDDIYVIRKSGDNVVSQVKVPLSYGPRRKFLERLSEMENGEQAERLIAIKLPRMSFEITAITYDAARQLPKVNSYKRTTASAASSIGRYYVGVPYILAFQLNVYAKTQDDALQVVEQILPYFNPQYSVSIKPYDGVNDIKEDVPIILNSVSFSDDYEGDMAQRRTIIYTLDFEMKVYFYGPAPGKDEQDKLIKEVNVNIYNMEGDQFFEAVEVKVDPPEASADSDYTIVTTIWDTPQ